MKGEGVAVCRLSESNVFADRCEIVVLSGGSPCCEHIFCIPIFNILYPISVDEAMGRQNIKVAEETKDMLDDSKRDNETWDDCLQRLAQLDRATRMDS